jgi:hypothetical protein
MIIINNWWETRVSKFQDSSCENLCVCVFVYFSFLDGEREIELDDEEENEVK